jgi:beta-lactamase superfamily II metal-dependent hydrolase
VNGVTRPIRTLEDAGLLAGAPLKVDVLKVPHHGSDNNVEPEFFEKIVADHYVFSGNGKHGNPERGTLDMLATARGQAAEYDVHLTYPVGTIDNGREAHLEQHHQTWNTTKDSLKWFFETKADQGYKFKVRAGDSIEIELGDETIAW